MENEYHLLCSILSLFHIADEKVIRLEDTRSSLSPVILLTHRITPVTNPTLSYLQ